MTSQSYSKTKILGFAEVCCFDWERGGEAGIRTLGSFYGTPR